MALRARAKLPRTCQCTRCYAGLQRNCRPFGRLDLWNGLTSRSVAITALAADVAATADAAAAWGTPGSHQACEVVMHTSGVLQDELLPGMTIPGLRRVMAPKLAASTAIRAHLFPTTPVHQLVLFSSIASLVGAAGQCSYAAANAVIDAWAEQASIQGMQAIAIQWGAWAAAGMASSSVVKRLRRIGQGVLMPQTGLSALASLMRSGVADWQIGAPVVAVNPFEWRTYRQHLQVI